MNRTFDDLRLEYLRICAGGPNIKDSLKKAYALISDAFHLSGIELEFIGEVPEGFDHSNITLFERPGVMPASDPLRFMYSHSKSSSTVIYFYPAGVKFAEEEKTDLELYASITALIISLNRGGGTDMWTQQLSGIPNGAGYMARVSQLMKQRSITDYCAFYLNLRGFANINRKFGNEVGDIVMRKYAETLNEFALKDGLAGHLGGDNFVAIVQKSRRESFLRFIKDVDLSFVAGEDTPELHIAAVTGIWDIAAPFENPGEVIRRPSIAYNEAKNILHTDAAVASDTLVRRTEEQQAVLNHYDTALKEHEFKVFYQPKVDSRSKRLVGAEALVRWFMNGKIISPGVFIPALEERGSILPLDYYVLKQTCEDIRHWIDAGINPVPVSVNFSRKDLADKKLAESINTIIKKAGIDRNLIEIEVTESVSLAEQNDLAAFTGKLSRLGIMTAIDDFGSGYSSLNTLRGFQVHTLKIDRSFVNSDDFSWKDEIILKNIMKIADELGIEVVSEGVERDDQLALMNSVGCYVIQGYYYDKPLPHDDFEKRLVDPLY
ncbi:MAG: GGDEF domain-containing phosphodiesterase [Lachnospiraceae bacterium]|nr:GGDEF domain-containing phosphodiesterase [Lachnospiraceae bacterium]